ncbi:PTS ascorbate-specific transporter subunit IIA [Aggregatibacter actinomycetemcomitans]|uniref:PTS sugar transporter subunit IIA n=1 Tax=Aggregatibacter actinomycetemcomitans TaxID=714 RepID=UPI0011D4D7D4|nr:PTS sugar transporter subunit IIA [Aggregatibacter actinomycetemcomitans]QEH45258.1 PTS ascorbate-specific transporter subunit IIA [Aggregatibacter actinomycetemcomitans]QEH47892.1 PTS ascorbate-specific transporter subunit IIA [Aggregatibacter actinomycetemcomitans]TYA50110.1 PTS ascorbate-specific transporter subunit IIA [Aggregatibacter actinomycetemcomitans]TYA51011.1 PTS ascorbate-specific transporter subunit IIA [Aggregatibacter actinomycetemcomitans]TYB29014.1 PTS ascorbate-specific 
MLKESLIENNSIILNQSASNWEEAIKIGTDLLVASGAIEPRYYDNIVNNIKKLGPYIVLAPGLAMPHARPEEGVIKTAFGLTTLNVPVDLDGESISVLLTLAGSDSNSHMEGIMEITQIFDDPNSDDGVNIQKFLDCKTTEEVLAVIDAALNA